jgi:hypothetical protein
MNIKKTADGYEVESSSKKGKWYSVDPKKPWCDCPAYKFRYMKSKTACKHIKAVREYVERTQQKDLASAQKETDDVLGFIEEKGGAVDSVELIDAFGEDTVESLLSQGEIMEKAGKITILK